MFLNINNTNIADLSAIMMDMSIITLSIPVISSSISLSQIFYLKYDIKIKTNTSNYAIGKMLSQIIFDQLNSK